MNKRANALATLASRDIATGSEVSIEDLIECFACNPPSNNKQTVIAAFPDLTSRINEDWTIWTNSTNKPKIRKLLKAIKALNYSNDEEPNAKT